MDVRYVYVYKCVSQGLLVVSEGVEDKRSECRWEEEWRKRME
jgi:hypothetical protein